MRLCIRLEQLQEDSQVYSYYVADFDLPTKNQIINQANARRYKAFEIVRNNLLNLRYLAGLHLKDNTMGKTTGNDVADYIKVELKNDEAMLRVLTKNYDKLKRRVNAMRELLEAMEWNKEKDS